MVLGEHYVTGNDELQVVEKHRTLISVVDLGKFESFPVAGTNEFSGCPGTELQTW